MSVHKKSEKNMQRRDNFVRFARGLLADPAVMPLLQPENKKYIHDTIEKIATMQYDEIHEHISSKIGPMRLIVGKSAGDFSVQPEDLVKVLFHLDAPAEIYRLVLFLQVMRLADWNKVMLYLNFFVETFGN